ncbi:MAG: deoxyguanosinetriphosphate triphosphohydrolase, partial [Bosea sp. (in: a-proteobacteria)]
DGRPTTKHAAHGVSGAILDYSARYDLWLSTHASAEAQVAALADDIAYNAHDIDDGLRAGLFDVDDLQAVPFLAGLLGDIRKEYPTLERTRLISELVRRTITRFVEDVITESARLLAESGVGSADEVRFAGKPLIAFSSPIVEADRAIKGFLFPRMYRHARVMRIRQEAAQVVLDLFTRFSDDPDQMPPEWRADTDGQRRSRRVCDYIAGMTDRYALDEHARLFDATPLLR